MTKRLRTSLVQREILFAFMQAHEDFARNQITGPNAEKIKKVSWNQLTQQLNSTGTGVVKTADKWLKCWQDWKTDVKAKYSRIKTFENTKFNKDEEVHVPCPLTELEEKLLQFLDVDPVEEDLNERQKRASFSQREMMLAFMQAHEEFGKNQITGPNAARVKKFLLNKLTKELNSSGPAAKSPEKWLKCWQDWKSDTKSKWQKLNNFKQAEAIMHDYVRSPCPLTPLEEKVVDFFGFGEMEDKDEADTWQDKKSIMKKRALNNPEQVTDIPPLLPQIQTNMNMSETPIPGPSTQESGVNIEDIFQAGSTIKVELDKLDSSDSDDPLNFEEEYLVSDPASPAPEPEPEIEQPRNTAKDRSRRRFRRVLRRPLTQSRLDVINHITVNEVKKALIQKNEIKKQFYAQYMVEIRKQTEALVRIANTLSNSR